MPRRRYIYVNGEMVEVTADYQPPSKHIDSGALWGDTHYDGMRAPDGADISTRTKHREYMRLNGVTTMDDFTQTWAKAEQKRDEYRTAGKGGAATRESIERAIHDLNRKK